MKEFVEIPLRSSVANFSPSSSFHLLWLKEVEVLFSCAEVVRGAVVGSRSTGSVTKTNNLGGIVTGSTVDSYYQTNGRTKFCLPVHCRQE